MHAINFGDDISVDFFSYLTCLLFLSFLLELVLNTTKSMSDDHDDLAERIAAARREAELLKDRIKQRRDALADTTCMILSLHYLT